MAPFSTTTHHVDNINIESVLLEFNQKTEEQIFFIQIGANDGLKQDAITELVKRFNWKGILVEPVPTYFERLQESFAGYEVSFENSAVTAHNGTQLIYRLAPSAADFPFWWEGLASLDKSIVLSHEAEIDNIEQHITQEPIQTIRFDTLLAKYDVSYIHVLHIDTEGHDYEIIRMIDFAKIRPEIIIYEYHHLTVRTYHQSIIYLKDNGYQVYQSDDSYDAIAIDATLLE